MELDLERLGQNVRYRREGRGWSLTDLADRSGVSKPYLSDLENGKGGRPNIQYLFRLANALDTTIDALIRGEAQPQATEPAAAEPLPPGLAEFAEKSNLNADEVHMLAKLNFRGSRPKDADAWRAIYEVIRLASK